MTGRLDRRAAVGAGALLLALTLAGPAPAQPAAKVYRIGWLSAAAHPMLEPFRQGLRDLGYVEGQNLLIEQRYADGKVERLGFLADELVRLPVDVLMVSGRVAAHAVRGHAGRVPVVFVTGDPVGDGIVTSLARPGNNITGMALMTHEIATKWIELAREALGASRIAILADPAGGTLQRRRAEETAQAIGLDWHTIYARTPDEIDRAFEAAARRRAQGAVVLSSPLFAAERARLVKAAARARIPVVYEHRDFVVGGGLMSYGPNVRDVFRRAAGHVDKIFKGTPAGELPVEQPTTLELVVNLKTARALGLSIPQSVLLKADAVLQ